VMSVWGANVNGQTRGTATNNAIYNLHLLTGRIATPGNSALSLDASASGTAGGVDTSAALSMARVLDSRGVRMLWIQGGNPAVDLPALDRLLRAPAGNRFVVVSDSYPTATTRVADVVLPSAVWFERDGIHVNAERRLQHNAELVSPPGDSTTFGWQMIEIARRLGLARLVPWERSNYEARAWEEFRAAAANQTPALPEMSALRADGAYQWGGGWNGRASVWLRPYEEPVESPDREYPFWLNTGAVLEHAGTGTLTRRIPTLHRGAPQAYVEMNREDAQRLGIRSGETVRLVSRRGALQLQARVDYRSQPQPGLVFVPSFDEALPVARLMPNAFDPLSGQPHTTTCAVRIERTTPGRGG
jgi:nitrate reductase (cytochrome)